MITDALIPRTRACRLFLGVSLVTAWRHERDDPLWPKPVRIGPKLVAYRESEVQRYIESQPLAPAVNRPPVPPRKSESGAVA